MIETTKRKLNPRYYAGSGTATVKTSFKYRLDAEKSDIPVLERWIRKVQQAADAFSKVRCQGTIKAISVSRIPGYSTEGKLFVFDDQSLKEIESPVTGLFNALRDRPNTKSGYKAYFTIVIKVTSFYLAAEGVRVPFKELDTERRQKPTSTKIVTLPNPMLN